MKKTPPTKPRHYNPKSGVFRPRHFFSGGFCRKVADSKTATFLVADFIPVQYVQGTTYNGHIPPGWSWKDFAILFAGEGCPLEIAFSY